MNKYSRIRLAFHWVKGIEMEFPANRFLVVCLGMVLLSIAASLLIHAIAPNGLLH